MGLQRLVAWLEAVKMKSDDERASWMEELIDPRLRGDFSHFFFFLKKNRRGKPLL
jgi:hypothetical protein